MKQTGNIIAGAMLKLLSLLPLWVLYRLADVIFVLLYFVVRYRRKLVTRNLTQSFPDKSHSEICRIRRKFYLNFADYIVETIKLGHISDKAIKRRMQFEDAEVLDRLLDKGKSIVIFFSHCGNWEWATSVGLWLEHPDTAILGQVYRPLKSDFTDRYMLKLRSRFHTTCYPKATVFRDLLRLRRDGRLSVTGFMSDQKPSHGDKVHVLHFLNHPTAVITGTETVARKLDMAVVYWDMSKISRGHYVITNRLIAESLADKPDFYATDIYIGMLQQTIARQPAIWLWSHNRWKRPVDLPPAQPVNNTVL